MAIKIKSIKESVRNNGIKILVHGQAGSGKTVMCGTAGEKTLLISAEGGLLALKGAIENGLLPEAVNELVDVVDIKNLDDLLEVYQYALVDKEHSWIMLDSISEIAEVVLENEKQYTKDPRQAYGNLITEMQSLLRKFRDIPQKNVLFTCKQQRIVDEDTNRTKYIPSMPGTKLHQAIPYMFDEVFALRVEKDDEKEDYRVLQTNRDINYEAKDRSGKLEMWEEPNLFSLMKKIGNVSKTTDETESNDIKDVAQPDSEESADECEICSDPLIDGSCHNRDCDMHGMIVLDDHDNSLFSDSIKYWQQKTTGKLKITYMGDDISTFINDDDVEEITKLKYTKLSKESEIDSE